MDTIDTITTLNPINLDNDLYKRHVEIHIKIQQRNGKKSFTTVEGLDKIELPANKKMDDFLNDIAKKFRKSFNCISTVSKKDNSIKLSGDQRDNISNLLINAKLVNQDQIKIHGF